MPRAYDDGGCVFHLCAFEGLRGYLKGRAEGAQMGASFGFGIKWTSLAARSFDKAVWEQELFFRLPRRLGWDPASASFFDRDVHQTWIGNDVEHR